MSAINDGGPAFPTQNGCRNDSGMSKREVIAKDALNGYLAGRNNSERTHLPGDKHHTDVAKACLRYADALLAALAPVEEPPPALDTPRETELRRERNLLAAAAEAFLSPNYTHAELERLAACTTGRGEIGPEAARKQLQLRAALGVMTAKGE